MSTLTSIVDAAEAISIGRSPLSSREILRAFQRDRLALFSQLSQAGDAIPFKVLGRPAVLLNHPKLVRTILVERPKIYTKRALLLKLVKPLLGDSLISSEGEIWKQQRLMLQPGFHKKQIAAWSAVMTSAVFSLLDQWALHTEHGEPFDAMPAIMQLTLRIASGALFDAHIGDQAEVLTTAFAQANEGLTAYFNRPLPPLPFPTPRNVRLQTTIWRLHRIAAQLLKDRRRDQAVHHDVLALMMTPDERGRKMRPRLVRDNILAFLFAGYETTAVAAAWTLMLLAQHPDIQQRAAEEVQTVLAGRTPTIHDLAHLPCTLMVIEESIRLYPPPAFIIRLAEQADDVLGLHIPKGAFVFICPYVLHRHPAFWQNPEQFAPERFAPEQKAAQQRGSYIPFNSGPHKCVGDVFATTEVHLLLSMLLQRFEVAQPEGENVSPEALLSIRPKGGRLRLLLRRRQFHNQFAD